MNSYILYKTFYFKNKKIGNIHKHALKFYILITPKLTGTTTFPSLGLSNSIIQIKRKTLFLKGTLVCLLSLRPPHIVNSPHQTQNGASSDSSQTSALPFETSSPSSSIESLMYSLCAKRSHSVKVGSSRSCLPNKCQWEYYNAKGIKYNLAMIDC